MISRAMLLMVLLSAGIAGCQTPPGRWLPPPANAPTQVCEGAICNVDVVVPSGCVINVTDVLDTRRGPSVQTINWNLKAPTGYKFSDAPLNWGIVIKEGSDQFRADPYHATKITVHFTHKVPPTFPHHAYGINIVRPEGPCPTKDPWVWE